MAGRAGTRAARRSTRRGHSSALTELASTGVGALVTGMAWVFLVSAAIDFGVAARNGQSQAWLFSLGASFGAVVALVLLLALVGRGLRTFGFLSEYQPRRAAPKRRR
ncbi:MAG TPA: hypothetical protein VFZ64_06885 [Nocardioidaceae bacterium]